VPGLDAGPSHDAVDRDVPVLRRSHPVHRVSTGHRAVHQPLRSN